jgi:hypothetical protein
MKPVRPRLQERVELEEAVLEALENRDSPNDLAETLYY